MAFFVRWEEPVAGEAPKIYKGLDAVQRMAAVRIPHDECKPSLEQLRPLWTFQWLLTAEQRVRVQKARQSLYESEVVMAPPDAPAAPDRAQRKSKKRKQQMMEAERSERERSLFD